MTIVAFIAGVVVGVIGCVALAAYALREATR